MNFLSPQKGENSSSYESSNKTGIFIGFSASHSSESIVGICGLWVAKYGEHFK